MQKPKRNSLSKVVNFWVPHCSFFRCFSILSRIRFLCLIHVFWFPWYRFGSVNRTDWNFLGNLLFSWNSFCILIGIPGCWPPDWTCFRTKGLPSQNKQAKSKTLYEMKQAKSSTLSKTKQIISVMMQDKSEKVSEMKKAKSETVSETVSETGSNEPAQLK